MDSEKIKYKQNYNKNYYIKNKDKIKAKYQAKKDEIKARQKAYYKKQKELINIAKQLKNKQNEQKPTIAEHTFGVYATYLKNLDELNFTETSDIEYHIMNQLK